VKWFYNYVDKDKPADFTFQNQWNQIMKFLLLLLLNCISLSLFAQAPAGVIRENIVPNAGFEKYDAAPIGWFYKGAHFTSVMKYWNAPTGASPDIFGPRVRVPNQWAEKGFGDQKARSGESMSGITAYGCENGKPHCREYIQIQLKEPLVPGQVYYAEFWASHLPRSLRINNLGMYFSEKAIGEITATPLEFTPQVTTEAILDQRGNQWIRVSGTFKADKRCEHLTVGNFFSDAATQTRSVHLESLPYAYYYIDDVMVIKQDPIIDLPIPEDDLCCITVEEGETVQLKDIFFDTADSDLLPRSFVELKKLLALMTRYSNMKIEIRGHTDNIGTEDYNLSLSTRRAAAVVAYLNKFGIHPDRTTYKGFGSQRPIADNFSTAGRQMNRRVEFLVLEK